MSFRGEKRTLTEADVRKLAGHLIRKAAATPGEPPFPPDEETPVTDALARRLLALGDLDMDDVQAVRLGRRALAEKLKGPAPDGLSADATLFLDTVTEWACVHILHFFTQRSTFIARTLVEQSRDQAELIAKVDELITRTPRPDARDAAFERRYLDHIADKHNRITIYGIDLRESTDRWPLEVAYLSLEATAAESRPVEGVHGVTDAPVTVQLPADAALDDHPRVLLRGDAGSGKTTLVQWLAVTAAREATRVPFVLPLRSLTRAAALPAPGGFLDAVGCPLTAPDGWAEQVLGTGRGLVMVDGIDEVPAGDRARTRDWLLDLTHAYPGNQWLVTSRPTAVRPTWLADRDFRELTLAPMTRSGVATFVHRWHTAAGAEPYEEQLRTALRGKRDLARMATNPLMCGLICALHRERRGFLPQSRKSLYDAALTMLLSRRDRERGMGAPDGIELGEEVQLELLQSLAYGLILSGRTEMDHDTALLLLERALPDIASAAAQGDAAAVFRHLLLRSGLLREPAPGIVHFVHRTFQDYLGARAAVADGHLDVLVSHAGDLPVGGRRPHVRRPRPPPRTRIPAPQTPRHRPGPARQPPGPGVPGRRDEPVVDGTGGGRDPRLGPDPPALRGRVPRPGGGEAAGARTAAGAGGTHGRRGVGGGAHGPARGYGVRTAGPEAVPGPPSRNSSGSSDERVGRVRDRRIRRRSSLSRRAARIVPHGANQEAGGIPAAVAPAPCPHLFRLLHR
ncbi:NACHT domain-containing protein [Streptomyces silvensis]|uniref:NACHT domain-containing protein n=1 Tax=Streptomyces silvensis TaxID=1765722 RepID=A0A0W7WYD1_9ACTN|nr:hypothetical protein AT728_26440 [Streptomyces silvensis]